METYTRVPQWLATDAGVRALAAPARVALYDIAVNGGHASCGADPVAALDALCAGAGASLPRMVDLGVVQVSGGRIYLMAPDGLPSAVGATTAPRPDAPAPRVGDASADGIGEPLRAAQRHLGALWTKASAKTLDARLAWLDTPAGERAIKRERITREQAVEIAARAGVNGGRFGTRSTVSTTVSTSARVDAVTASTTVSTDLPSQTLPSQKEQENTREERTRAVSTRGVYSVAVDTVTASTPAASTIEHVGAKIEPDVILGAMGRASGGLVSMAGSAPELVAFRDALRGYVAQGFALERITAATSHLAHDHWTQRQRRTGLSASRLVAAGHNGRPSILTELLAESETCPKCSAASAPVAPKPAAPIVRPKPASPAEARRAIEAARAKPAAEGEGHV